MPKQMDPKIMNDKDINQYFSDSQQLSVSEEVMETRYSNLSPS